MYQGDEYPLNKIKFLSGFIFNPRAENFPESTHFCANFSSKSCFGTIWPLSPCTEHDFNSAPSSPLARKYLASTTPKSMRGSFMVLLEEINHLLKPKTYLS